MNIFYLDENPWTCAQWMVDRHVVKMILETCQLLSTAHRVLDGTAKTVITQDKHVIAYDEYDRPFKKLVKGGRKKTVYVLADEREAVLYQATHINHPSAVWCRQSNENYNWLYSHLVALLDEYTFRYGRVHKCLSLTTPLQKAPLNIPSGSFTEPPAAMDSQFIVSSSAVDNYRNYYKYGKAHLHGWTNRNIPEWLTSLVRQREIQTTF